jgi:hypothetical protein
MNIRTLTAEKRAQGTHPWGPLGAMGWLLASTLAPLLALGCAKSPTLINVQVSADDTVPPMMILRSKIAREADPLTAVPNEILSRSYSGDAGSPDPFRFPLLLPVAVPSGWSGAMTITVEGLSWDTGAVIATGSTAATATRETTTEAMLTLIGVPGQGGEGDGGGDGRSG